MAKKDYRKLPGRGTRYMDGSRFFAMARSTCTLWLGADHVLLVLASPFTQDFKRFYLRDIQAITVRKTKSALILTLSLFAFAALFGFLSLGVEGMIGRSILWVISGVLATLALINAIGGQSCIVELKTAVQTEELSSLKRLRKANKTLAILQPLIEEAQGSLSAEQVITETDAALLKAEGQPGLANPTGSRGPLKPCSGTVHLWLFAALLIDGILSGLWIFFQPMALLIAQTVIMLVAAALAIVALIQQHETDVTAALRRTTWGALIYIFVGYLVSMVQGIAITAGNSSTYEQWALFEEYIKIDPLQTPWLFWSLMVSSILSLVIAMGGLILTTKFRAHKKRSSSPPELSLRPGATS